MFIRSKLISIDRVLVVMNFVMSALWISPRFRSADWSKPYFFDNIHRQETWFDKPERTCQLPVSFVFNRWNEYAFFTNYRFLDNRYSRLRTAFRSRVKLEYHLVFLSFYLDVHIESCHFVSRWSREWKVRKISFKRKMKISRSNRYLLFFNID